MKGYRATLSKVFKARDMELSTSWEISDMIKHFEKSCSPQNLKPPDWDTTKVLASLTKLPYEPIKTSSDRESTLKAVFLPALASPKRVGEIHALGKTQDPRQMIQDLMASPFPLIKIL